MFAMLHLFLLQANGLLLHKRQATASVDSQSAPLPATSNVIASSTQPVVPSTSAAPATSPAAVTSQAQQQSQQTAAQVTTSPQASPSSKSAAQAASVAATVAANAPASQATQASTGNNVFTYQPIRNAEWAANMVLPFIAFLGQ
ncbi:hypothetical protein EDD86DRAFT_266181 [Gorgonomyces haynaldii]|nr:hypothetical protein EDD86DRAFT_266181 [Gorgonomyces haynaldii]